MMKRSRSRAGVAAAAAAAVAVAVIVFVVLPSTVLADCPNHCAGHGHCDSGPLTTCSCYNGWGGGDCSLRLCPTGLSWADAATSDDHAHAIHTECSGRGVCDYGTGKCKCEEGFEGLACQRMSCRQDCQFRGKCVTMRRHALNFRHTYADYAYNLNWDANMIHGCECDAAFEGHDCSLRKCPRGDDPMTHDQVNEVQLTHCTATSGFIVLYLDNQPSAHIRASATADEIKQALLPATDVVSVTFPDAADSTFCDNDGAITRIEFLQRFGDVPRLTFKTDWQDHLECTACSLDFVVKDDVDGDLVKGATYSPIQGTKEWEYCSRRGRCNQETGLCECYKGYYSSDGYSLEGILGDCGAPLDPITSCPGTPLECSGHGVCNDFPQYRCECNVGWTGGDCSERICPFGPSWFDVPTANNDAHAEAECSNKGICDRKSGHCVCEDGFGGEACERMLCPQVGEEDVCSGHGQCMSMAQLAENADLNGDATDYTYGAKIHEPSTWDAKSVYGCKCDPGYHGYDCSLMDCPTGDDPHTPGVKETQSLVCTAESGTFTLMFRQEESAPIPWDATMAEFEVILEDMDVLGDVETICPLLPATDPICDSAGSNTIEITFNQQLGDLPMLTLESNDLGHSTLTPDVVLGLIQDGTTENDVCSNRGICNESTGVCRCFTQWGSSDGSNGPGDRGDCGYVEPFIPVPTAQIDYQGWAQRNHAVLLAHRAAWAAETDDQFV